MADRLSTKFFKLCTGAAPLLLGLAVGAPHEASAFEPLRFLAAPSISDTLHGTAKVVQVGYDRPCNCNPCGPCAPGSVVPERFGDGSDAAAPNSIAEGSQPLDSASLGDEQFAGLGSSTMTINDAPGGYIDNPIVGTWFRLRYDDANTITEPDRAEFIYATYGGTAGASGPGPISPTGAAPTKVDMQMISAYGEVQLAQRLSVFAEIQQVWNDLDFPDGPDGPATISSNSGFGDMNAGLKYALYTDPCRYLTFQFKIYIPTGSALLGLGTNHVSYEPGLLYLRSLSARSYFQGELRYWVPDGGQQGFQGNVFRWGAGVGYDLFNTGLSSDGLNPYYSSGRRLTAVTEFVGWEVLNGLERVPGDVLTIDPVSAKASIVNLKLGLRATAGCHSLYTGWGHAITSDAWYDDLFRLEYRRMF